jgi:type II secretory pathway pseudopilin PulG
MNLKKESGFTLIEMALGIFLVAMIGLGFAAFQRNVFSLSFAVEENMAIQQQIRQIFLTMTDEIRMINVSDTGTYPIVLATNTAITFYSDIDNDGLRDRVRYYLSGKMLKKGVTKPTGSPLSYISGNEKITDIINNVVNAPTKPIFKYYDSSFDNYSSTTPLSLPISIPDIRLIGIALVIDRYTFRSPGQIEMSTQAMIRNLKDN